MSAIKEMRRERIGRRGDDTGELNGKWIEMNLKRRGKFYS